MAEFIFLPAAFQSISTTCPVQTHVPTFYDRINIILATSLLN